MRTPVITVLMPVYNAEKYLKEAVDSILRQTFNDFEFLIIDDYSTDSSSEILASYVDARIRIVRNERNMGMSATLNRGIELCRTELIARMDADDISYPDRLEKQFQFFQSHPDNSLLYTWAREITTFGEPVVVEEYEPRYFYYASNFENWIYHPTVMYRRSAVMDIGMYSVFYCEDYDLFWRMSRKYIVACLPEVLLDYRLSDESLCRVVRKTEYEEAHREQVARNIRYYAGKDFPLNYEEIECYLYNYEPLKNTNDLKKMIECVQKLDHISLLILKKKNVNAVEDDIKNAWKYKRSVILEGLAESLSKSDKAQLYMATRSWNELWKGIGKFVHRFAKQ